MGRFIQFFFVVLFFHSTNNFAQNPPIEWGEIPLSDLKMTSFPDDSNATAVILCDYGESKLNDDLDIEYERHLRVKILNENGYHWGTHIIYIYKGKNGERLSDIEAVTYSLDDSGEIIETELDDDNIFEEEVTEDRFTYTFSMPGLKPGCIIDIRYKIIAESLWYVRGWVFQEDEPVLWSEYRFIYPRNIAFANVSLGYEPWTVMDYQEIKKHFRGFAESYLGNMPKCNYYRWVVQNAPAIRDEPFITTVNDYKNRVDIQLAGYSFINSGKKEFLTTWTALVNDLMDHENFGETIDPSESKEITDEIIKGIDSPEEKMKAIYSWVSHSIVWSGRERVIAEYDIHDIIKYKKGNTADISFLLISMLNNAGIDANPVILSTRSNGRIQEEYPIVEQFNYTIAKVNIGTKTFYLDATDPLRSYDLLPVEILNVKALVVKQDSPQWVFISTPNKNIDKSVINVTLIKDGSLSATIEEKFGNYESHKQRRENKEKTDIEIVKNIFDTESSGFKIDSAEVFEKDNIDLPLRVKAQISASNYSQIGGELIYFNPTLIHRFQDNPLKTKIRKFPIDYAYPREQMIITNVNIPAGYELKEKYGNKNFQVDNSASFTRLVALNNNTLQIINKLEIKESEIKSASYNKLKDFYAHIVAAQSEIIVLGPVKK